MAEDADKRADFESFRERYVDTTKTLKNQEESGIIIVDEVIEGHVPAPKKHLPNSVVDHKNEKGAVDSRSFYGESGMKEKDIHTGNHGNPKMHPFGKHGEHAHDYVWGKDGRLISKTPRDLTNAERKDNGDIL